MRYHVVSGVPFQLGEDEFVQCSLEHTDRDIPAPASSGWIKSSTLTARSSASPRRLMVLKPRRDSDLEDQGNVFVFRNRALC